MYSKDLRKKVINFLGKGNTQRKTAEIFGINKAAKKVGAKRKFYLTLDRSIAPLTFTGSCNRELFEAWVEQGLIKNCRQGNA